MLLFLVGCGTVLSAQQLNMPNYWNKKRIRFGFTLGLNSNDFKVRVDYDKFHSIDTLKSIGVKRFPGFLLGGIADYRINDNFNLRFLPSLALGQRNITYVFANSKSNREVKIESVYIDFPILLKYRTRRFGNYGFYVIGGGKFSIDLASNINANRSLSDPVVAVVPNSYSYELGFGLDIYFPYFKFSPEIKISNSINNVLVKDGFVYTETFNGFWSRIVNFSFHFE